MSRRKIKTTLCLTEEQLDDLDEVHLHTGLPIAELIRQAVELVVTGQTPLARQVGWAPQRRVTPRA